LTDPNSYILNNFNNPVFKPSKSPIAPVINTHLCSP